MKYLFDSNILGEMIRKRPNRFVQKRFGQVPHDSMFTSAICWFEVSFGMLCVPDPDAVRKRFESQFFPQLEIIPLARDAAEIAAEIRAELRQLGRSAEASDLLIAATARSYGLTIVTGNVSDFEHVPRIRVENWFE